MKLKPVRWSEFLRQPEGETIREEYFDLCGEESR
jgi:hypothetical protein